MAYLHQRYALIGISVTLIMMILDSDGVITTPPINKAVLLETSRVAMSCAADAVAEGITWTYLPVGGSAAMDISYGLVVVDAQKQFYEAQKSGPQQINLIILSATMARAGTYYCFQREFQASAQMIVINSDPVCGMTPNAPTDLLYNQEVQMSCSVTYTANTSYVAVDMIWSKGSPAIVVNSSTPQYTTSGTLTTAVSNITQVPGNFTPFPIFSCNTSFKVTGNPPASANNAPDYSKSTQLFSSPINVTYLKPADANSITGAKSGDRVYLGTTVTCKVEGNPPPSYSWLDVRYGNTTNTSSIQTWHDGEYQCTAWNKAASTSASINVTTYTTTAAPITTTTTTPTTTVTSQSTSPSGSDMTAPQAASGPGGLSETNKIIIGVVVGVGGALLIVAITILICCCLKKNKADKYSGSSEGTLSKPPPYEDGGHRGPQRSTNPDLVQGGYPMDEYSSKDLSSPYSTTSHHDRPYIDEDGLNYAQIQLDNNPRSRQPLQVAEGTNYSDVRLA